MKFSFLFAIWGVLVTIGFGLTMSWSMKPGSEAKVIRPETVSSELRVEGVFHPDCPCSAASIELMSQALEMSDREFQVTLFFVGKGSESKNVALAKKISGSELVFLSEHDGVQRFGEATSGQIFVWRGQDLLFSGGVTDARGESAQGAAYRAFLSALDGEASDELLLPTYGCPLGSPN